MSLKTIFILLLAEVPLIKESVKWMCYFYIALISTMIPQSSIILDHLLSKTEDVVVNIWSIMIAFEQCWRIKGSKMERKYNFKICSINICGFHVPTESEVSPSCFFRNQLCPEGLTSKSKNLAKLTSFTDCIIKMVSFWVGLFRLSLGNQPSRGEGKPGSPFKPLWEWTGSRVFKNISIPMRYIYTLRKKSDRPMFPSCILVTLGWQWNLWEEWISHILMVFGGSFIFIPLRELPSKIIIFGLPQGWFKQATCDTFDLSWSKLS